MKKLITIMLFIPFICNGQGTFFRSYGGSGNDFGEAVLLTSDSCYLVVGATESFGNGVTDLYVFKVDALGDYLWSNIYGGPNIEYGTDAVELDDGSFLLCGYSNSSNFDYDYYIVKIDEDGQHQWTKRYGGEDWDLAYSICEINHSNKGFIIAGETYSYGLGNTDAYLIKINEDGDTLWTKTYGGNEKDVFNEVIEDDFGNIICIGSSSSNTQFNDADIWIVKTDSIGNEIWNIALSDTLNDEGISICLAANGNYLIAGNDQQATNTAAFFAALDTSGTLIYSNEYSGALNDYSSSILRYNDSTSYTLVANSYSFASINEHTDLLVTQLNGMFAMNGLSSVLGTDYDEFSKDADTTIDHGIIITGTTTGTANGMNSIFLLKLDTLLNANNALTEDLDLSSPILNMNDTWTIYPNPVADFIQIEGLQNNETLYLFNSEGKLIKYLKFSGNTMNLSNLKSGIYYISTKEKNKENKCFIKL